MSEESFNNHVEALATKRLEKPKTISAQSGRFWGEIESKQYHFERGMLYGLFLNIAKYLQHRDCEEQTKSLFIFKSHLSLAKFNVLDHLSLNNMR